MIATLPCGTALLLHPLEDARAARGADGGGGVIQWLNDWLNGLTHALGGPARLRFILQPLIAMILAVRDGRLDARAGTPPFVWNVLFDPSARRESWRSAMHVLWKPLVVATVMDAIVQHLVMRSVRPGHAVLTGCLLVGLPYVLVRGLTNRLSTDRMTAAQDTQ